MLTRPDDDLPGGNDLTTALAQAQDADPALLADLLAGAADAPARLSESGGDRVLGALADQAPAVLAALWERPPPVGAPDLDVEVLLDAVAAAGAGKADPLRLLQRVDDRLGDRLYSDLVVASELPVDRWPAEVAEAEATIIQPVARLYGAIARDVCAAEPKGPACAGLLDDLAGDLADRVAQLVYETSPPSLLPAPLLDDGTRQPLNDVNRDQWVVTLEQLGLDVVGDVRAAALG